MIRSLSAASLPFTLTMALVISGANSWAASFDFTEEGSGIVLATLHTDSTDPFDHSNITSLSFTSEGDVRFGFGSGSYPGTFDSTFAMNRWISDGFGGLTTVDVMVSGIISDNTPPSSTVLMNAQTPIFSIGLEPTSSGQMTLVDGTLPDFITIQGMWNQVPEPSSMALLTAGLIGFCQRWRVR